MQNATSSVTGLHELLGFEMIELRRGFARVALSVEPRHHNRAGIIHGGLLLAVMDEAAGSAGILTGEAGMVRPSVTITLTGQFTGRADRGLVTAASEIVSHGRTIYHARTEVRDEAGTLLAYGSSAHRWQSQTVHVPGAPPG